MHHKHVTGTIGAVNELEGFHETTNKSDTIEIFGKPPGHYLLQSSWMQMRILEKKSSGYFFELVVK
jgi:hypothetical protein